MLCAAAFCSAVAGAAKACFGWDVLLYICRISVLVRYHVLCQYAFHFLILRTHAGSQQAHFSPK